jgi:hypothetical protein
MTAANCTSAELDGGPAAVCVTASFVDFYSKVVPIFCGPPGPGQDGGSLTFDASSDAAVEPTGDASSDARNDSPADAGTGSPSDGRWDEAVDAEDAANE